MKALYYIQYLVLLLLCSVFTSCEEEYNPDLGGSDTNILSISGCIQSYEPSYIYIQWITDSPGAIPRDLDRLNPVLTLIGSDGSVETAHHYFGDQFVFYALDLSVSTYYTLHLSTYDFEIETNPIRPCVTPKIADLSYRQWPDTHEIDILTTCEPTSEQLYLKYTYEEDWEVRTRFDCLWSYNLETREFERKHYHTNRGWIHRGQRGILIADSKDYKENSIVNYTLNSFAHTDTRAYNRYRIRMTQRAISKDEYGYCVARSKCGGEVGGIFSPMPVEYPTNLNVVNVYRGEAPRVVGFVGFATNVEKQEIYIDSDSLYYENIIKGEYMRNDDSTFIGLDYYINNGWLLCELRNKDTYGVASPQLVDCIYWGASIYPPWDWVFDVPYNNWSWILYNETVPLYDY